MLALLALLTLGACHKPVAQAAAVGPPAPKVTINALVWAPDWTDEMQQIAAEFMRLNPDVRVNLQFMIGNSIEENMKPTVTARKLPDLMSINPNAYAAELAEQGIFADVSKTEAWANMLPSLKADWTTRSNKRFGISGGVAATLIYYNRSMFEKAGIKNLPTNFDEFLAVCAQLKKAGFTPIMWNGGFPNMMGNGPFSFGFANNVVAHTPDWKERMAKGTLDLDTPEGADIFAKIKLIAERGYAQPGYINTNYDEGMHLFTEGKTAMAFHGTWASGALMHGKGFQTGVFIPPWNARGRDVIPVLGSETGFAVCETPNKAAALRFLDFIFGRGFVIQHNKRQNIPPLENMPGKIMSDMQIVAYINTISKYPVSGTLYYSFLPANTIEMLHPLIQSVLADKVTPQQAAKALDASIKHEAKHNYK
ncbi:MAG: extracellular solute-binding protein [Pseudomonadota bacterium]